MQTDKKNSLFYSANKTQIKLKLMALIISFTVLLSACNPHSSAQNIWYVDQNSGSNSNTGSSLSEAIQSLDYALESQLIKAGDTVYIVGSYKNKNYNDGDIWKTENTIKINNLHGSKEKYISIKAFDDKTILKGDGQSIIRINNSSYIKIEGFEIYGEVDNIPLETALKYQFIYKDSNGKIHYRVPQNASPEEIAKLKLPVLKDISRPSYTDTKGIYISKSEHIIVSNNHIHHMPGTGLRAAKSDYIDIIANEINDCSRRSYSGTHALVIHSSKSLDNSDAYKIRILRNKVHHNYNEIYSWSPKKTFITPHIDEGKGISLQKNSLENGWKHGRILVANNISYWNGFSGLHNNQGVRIDFINNTVYLNSYTNSITNKGKGGGKNIGISSSGGADVKIINNIVVSDSKLKGFAISVANTENLFISDNLIYGNQDPDIEDIQKNNIIARPNFANAENFDFRLKAGSPAIDKANANYAPKTDYYNKTRDSRPDIGAIEN